MATLDSAGLTETFDMLSHPYRRYVLYYLSEAPGSVEVDALATAIARWDGDHTGGPTDVEEVTAALHHVHLPKLADAGFVTYGRDLDGVALSESAMLDRFLDDAAPIDGYAQVIADD